MQPQPTKPGYKTSEFLAVLLFAIGALASSLADALSPKWAAIAIAVASGAYAVSRGLAKASVQIHLHNQPQPPQG